MIHYARYSHLICSLSHWLNKLCSITAVFFLFMMLFLVVMQVITRYAFEAAPQWTEEGARYSMIWMGLLGSTVSFYHKQDPVLFHPNSAMMKKWNFPIRLAKFSTVMIFIFPLIYFGPAFIMRHMGRLTEALEIDMALVVAIVPLYACIVAIHALAFLFSRNRVLDE